MDQVTVDSSPFRRYLQRMSKFVDEILVDGALLHVLDCGHFHEAQQDEQAIPVEEQHCEKCEKPAALPN